MSKNKALVILGVLVVVGVAVTLLYVLAPEPQAGPPVGATQPLPVTLTYSPTDCVTTDPPAPQIFQTGQKPHAVMWVVDPGQAGRYHWRISYQASSPADPKKQGTGDYLGPVELDCEGGQQEPSKTAPSLGASALTWPYKIEVLECDGVTPVCTKDPIIWIKR
jgi:hypothetical protein